MSSIIDKIHELNETDPNWIKSEPKRVFDSTGLKKFKIIIKLYIKSILAK